MAERPVHFACEVASRCITLGRRLHIARGQVGLESAGIARLADFLKLSPGPRKARLAYAGKTDKPVQTYSCRI